MHSTGYIIRFVLVMTTVAALVLAFLATSLKPLHEKNEAIYNKRAILAAVGERLEKPAAELSAKEIQSIFDENINQIAINAQGNEISTEQIKSAGYPDGKPEDISLEKEKKKDESERIYPIFVYEDSDGKKSYIVSIRGQGLWDAIWGNIALNSDFKSIVGASFDHAGETPGLGAEIKDNPAFSEQFEGKRIYNEGEYTSVEVVKGVVKHPDYQVDGISGATITSDGVSDMMYSGIKNYESFFKEHGLEVSSGMSN